LEESLENCNTTWLSHGHHDNDNLVHCTYEKIMEPDNRVFHIYCGTEDIVAVEYVREAVASMHLIDDLIEPPLSKLEGHQTVVRRNVLAGFLDLCMSGSWREMGSAPRRNARAFPTLESSDNAPAARYAMRLKSLAL
jgi:hypothetical protein